MRTWYILKSLSDLVESAIQTPNKAKSLLIVYLIQHGGCIGQAILKIHLIQEEKIKVKVYRNQEKHCVTCTDSFNSLEHHESQTYLIREKRLRDE